MAAEHTLGGSSSPRTITVMLAVDKSIQAQEAFDFYADTLHVPGNRVVLVHVPEGPTVKLSEGMHLPDGEWQKMRDHEKKETSQLVKIFADKIAEKKITDSEYKTVHGTKPGEALVEAAKDIHATMIIIGTRGMGAMKRTLMGSVSTYVVHHAHVPVIICRTK
ncbi:hypothetical protein CAPTEDRAFT_221183 [Capitella teleta]|uniref:UspA domain-containing protein n=1 Tax=Capitella teleta TaxID=283909 RepID=R7T548_CAPTE|nr:hypothetical protein CAPTEDRAFT_221183 [Capitella teleta]|eukprot:ELT88138.1 hypothetical protein CAPTEDRAFT_221183 [Capitella teleta]